MIVADLRNLIKDIPDDYPILLSRDSEGTGFRPLDEGEVYTAICKDHLWDILLDATEVGGQPVLLLWPE